MDVSSTDFWIKIGVAVLCGAMIGLERQLRGKPSGIRTSIFICMGTALFITLGTTHSGPGADSTRVLGQVVTGVGFLGAGVIMTRGINISGVTSAAVVWVLAALGSTVGFGHYAEALSLTFMTVVILAGIGFLENRFSHLRKGVHQDTSIQH